VKAFFSWASNVFAIVVYRFLGNEDPPSCLKMVLGHVPMIGIQTSGPIVFQGTPLDGYSRTTSGDLNNNVDGALFLVKY